MSARLAIEASLEISHPSGKIHLENHPNGHLACHIERAEVLRNLFYTLTDAQQNPLQRLQQLNTQLYERGPQLWIYLNRKRRLRLGRNPSLRLGQYVALARLWLLQRMAG